MGGVGSTVLMEFLGAQPELVVNAPHGVINPLKHPLRPPKLPGIQRAIFVFGCPYLSLLSLFRRGYDAVHLANISGLFSSQMSDPPDPWTQTCEAFGLRRVPAAAPGKRDWVDAQGRFADAIGALDWFFDKKREVEALNRARDQRIEAHARSLYHDLDDYLRQGQDHLKRCAQIEAWFERPSVQYPILYLRYDAIWSQLERLFRFVGIPPQRAASFPEHRPRSTSLSVLKPSQREQLEALYGSLEARLAASPSWRISK